MTDGNDNDGRDPLGTYLEHTLMKLVHDDVAGRELDAGQDAEGRLALSRANAIHQEGALRALAVAAFETALSCGVSMDAIDAGADAARVVYLSHLETNPTGVGSGDAAEVGFTPTPSPA